MTKLLSICIPTMNRAEWLLHAIKSICADTTPLGEIEVCISNNCSESDYSVAEKYIKSVSRLVKINYVRHRTRLLLDENHHYVKQMASGNYVYFLGDDDFFLRDQLKKLIVFIKENKPDLAIFNGFIVDANNDFIGMHCNLPSKEYSILNEAYVDLRDKGSFGAVLAHKDLLQDDDFLQLYETAHAYGCFWLSIFRKYDRSESIKIFIPDFPCVALRSSQKNYNFTDVYYKKIPNWMNAFKRLSPAGLPMQLIINHEGLHYEKISSIIFLLNIFNSGSDPMLIEKENPSFYKKHVIRINLCKFIYELIPYVQLKILYKFYLRKVKTNNPNGVSTEINNLIGFRH
jgi:abequosyltransferase